MPAQGLLSGWAVLLTALMFAASARAVELPAALHVAVCVVGQLSRTETASKVANLVRPNLAEGTMLDVFLVLQLGAARFTNHNSKSRTCNAAPESLAAAAAAFEADARTFKSSYHYINYTVPDRGFDYPNSGNRKGTLIPRLTNHINQFRSWAQCGQVVEAQELADGKRYDAVLRLRDNALVLEPFSMRSTLARLATEVALREGKAPPGVLDRAALWALPTLVKECSGWGGYSDKTMLVPRAHLYGALYGPTDEFYLVQKSGIPRQGHPFKIKNPESYIKFVFHKQGVPVHMEPEPEHYPVTDARCEDGETFCVVPYRKDCYPDSVKAIFKCRYAYFNGRPDAQNPDTKVQRGQHRLQARTKQAAHTAASASFKGTAGASPSGSRVKSAASPRSHSSFNSTKRTAGATSSRGKAGHTAAGSTAEPAVRSGKLQSGVKSSALISDATSSDATVKVTARLTPSGGMTKPALPSTPQQLQSGVKSSALIANGTSSDTTSDATAGQAPAGAKPGPAAPTRSQRLRNAVKYGEHAARASFSDGTVKVTARTTPSGGRTEPAVPPTPQQLQSGTKSVDLIANATSSEETVKVTARSAAAPGKTKPAAPSRSQRLQSGLSWSELTARVTARSTHTGVTDSKHTANMLTSDAALLVLFVIAFWCLTLFRAGLARAKSNRRRTR